MYMKKTAETSQMSREIVANRYGEMHTGAGKVV